MAQAQQEFCNLNYHELLSGPIRLAGDGALGGSRRGGSGERFRDRRGLGAGRCGPHDGRQLENCRRNLTLVADWMTGDFPLGRRTQAKECRPVLFAARHPQPVVGPVTQRSATAVIGGDRKRRRAPGRNVYCAPSHRFQQMKCRGVRAGFFPGIPWRFQT